MRSGANALVWALSELALTVAPPMPVFGHYWGDRIHIYGENEMFQRGMDDLNRQIGEQHKGWR